MQVMLLFKKGRLFFLGTRHPGRLTSLRSVHGSANPLSKTRSTKGPLSGVRVLDLTRVLAGPFASMLLADLGAEVIKVERPGQGDDTRSWGPPFCGTESTYFLSVNRGKKSIAVNIKSSSGAQIIQELSKKCDVLLENYLPGKMDKLGLGYDVLSKLNPSLVYCSITGFGPGGPYDQRPGYDVIVAAMGGLMHVTGPQDGDPCKVGVALTDICTGLYAHGAVMAALIDKQRTGKGQKIDCSLLASQCPWTVRRAEELMATEESFRLLVVSSKAFERETMNGQGNLETVAVLTHIATSYLNTGFVTGRYGTAHHSIVPYQTFQTKDGHVMVGAGNDGLFKKLCQVIEMPYLPDDPQYRTNNLRVKNREELLEIIAKQFMAKTSNEWLTLLELNGIPSGPINNVQQVFDDPQVKFKNLVQELDHPTVGTIRMPSPAVEYNGTTSLVTPSAPPLLGQHTAEVLRDVLGYDESHVESMCNSGVVATHKEAINR